jgi:hypothetical protein
MTHATSQTVKDKRTGREYRPGEWVIVAKRPECDVCQIRQVAFYDARTSGGRWGYVCATHFRTLDCSLGLGRGQRLMLEDDVELVTK